MHSALPPPACAPASCQHGAAVLQLPPPLLPVTSPVCRGGWQCCYTTSPTAPREAGGWAAALQQQTRGANAWWESKASITHPPGWLPALTSSRPFHPVWPPLSQGRGTRQKTAHCGSKLCCNTLTAGHIGNHKGGTVKAPCSWVCLCQSRVAAWLLPADSRADVLECCQWEPQQSRQSNALMPTDPADQAKQRPDAHRACWPGASQQPWKAAVPQLAHH